MRRPVWSRVAVVAALVLALFVAGAPAAVAQVHRPHLTLSGFAGGALWHDKVNVENSPIYGGRVGVHVGDRVLVGIEGTYGFSPGETSAGPWPFEPTVLPTQRPADPTASVDEDITHVGLDLVISAPWKVAPYVFGGWQHVNLENNDPNWGNTTFHGWEVGGGVKFFVAPRISIRVEARDVAFEFDNPPGEAPDDQTQSLFLTAGIEVAIDGATADADKDVDGVPDSRDACPGTAFGAVVDEQGCATDEDGDGVPDGLDVCVNTPRGAIIDEHGCPRDADRDGVPDGVDECADTPAGYPVDARGCPRDSDGDGVLDGADKCPGTPAGATIDEHGCPQDSDWDGVPDGLDRCADTPLGVRVDAEGCPTDEDGDGVPDGADKCPGTASNVRVDKDGCPIEISEKEIELLDTGKITVHNIQFETNKADLKPESHAILDEIGGILVQWPDLRIEIGGHADARGTDEYNRALSQRRAQAVLDYMLAKFPQIRAGQYVAKGYGESQPVATNATDEGMALNRRVEFKVLNPEVMRKDIERRRLLEKNE